jgi:signal transduction histidine kinase
VGFKIAARTLLELGKELISSDEVAIYEIIKNSVDARAAKIRVSANIVIVHAEYQRAIDDLADGVKTASIYSRISEKVLHDAPTDSVTSFLSEVKEGVGNKSKFKKALDSAYRKYNWLEFSDDGHGMSFEELDQVYLTVGTRSRRKDNIQGSMYLGDKGVGRLSVMRLGELLQVETTTSGEPRFNQLNIDWSIFDHDSDEEIGSIQVDPVRGRVKTEKSAHGTSIKVSSLHGDWPSERFAEKLNGPVAKMVDPFVSGRANSLIQAYHNNRRYLISSIPVKLLQSAHAFCKVRMKFEGGDPVISGVMNYSLRQAERKISLRGVEVYSVTQRVIQKKGKKGHAAVIGTPIRAQALKELGEFEVEFYWYNRLIVEAIDGLTEKVSETKQQIAKWAGGLMLFRHGFRVLPYGEPDDDWLELDKRAFGSAGFKLNRQQIIGRVLVHSPHTSLGEQTNREGLMETQAASALKSILMWLMHTEFRGFINDVDEYETINKREARMAAERFRETEKHVYENLDELRGVSSVENLQKIKQLENNVRKLADECSALVGNTEKIIKESAEEYNKFLHLAGIGLITEFIFHELYRTVESAISRVKEALVEFPSSRVLENLDEQLKTLSKRVSAFDDMTGEKRQTKSNFDLSELIISILESHSSQFSRDGVCVDFDRPDHPVNIHAVKGMVIQVIENLISNSLYWLRYQGEYSNGFEPRIMIAIDPNGPVLEFADNGPGVDPERAEIIFKPLVSSKPANQGRGLGLYISREIASYHGWRLFMDQSVGSVRKGRLNTFVLDMEKSK